MAELLMKLECPNCSHSIDALVEDEESCLFLLFICPNCKKNVVYYDNKMDIISDRMVMKLLCANKLKICGEFRSSTEKKTITEDDLVNLKIALETSKDVNDFLKKI